MKPFNIILYVLMLTFLANQNEVKKEEILLKNGNIELPGTLTTPKDSNKLIIWIHGSGNIDRNGNQAGLNVGANYIAQFREAINKKNIAFYSYDKRTANPKNMPYLMGIKFDDLVSDAKIVARHFKEKKQFNKIILVGHSQGSLIAMLASEEADKIVSLSGPGEGVDKTIIKQVSAQNPILGLTTKAHVKELKETGTIKQVDPNLLALFAPQNQPFLSNWFEYNPAVEITKVKAPLLIINGDQDLQVKEEDANKLKAAKPKAELKIIKNMNHVLKTVNSLAENQASYASAKFPLSKELIQVVTEFVNK